MVNRFFPVAAVLVLFALGAVALSSSSKFSFNFAHPRDVQNWDSFAIMGDAGIRNPTTDLLRKTLADNKLNNLILPGDNLYITTSTYASTWDVWKNDGFLFPFVAIGNHNLGYSNEVAYFQMPSEYYAKESKGALFVVLNSDNEATAGEQIAWADRVLAQSQYPLNFIVYHHPTVTLSGTHHWEEKRNFQMGMRQILKKYKSKITSLLVGHDHSAGLYTLDETPLILSGAAWESRDISLPAPKDNEINVLGYWATVNKGFWWTRLDYNALTKEVYVHFNRFDKQQDVCTFRIVPKPIAQSRGCL